MDDVLLPKNAVQIIRGASKTLQLTVRDSRRKPVNLTGTTLVMTVKDRVEDQRVLFQKSTADASQIEVLNAFSGVAQIFIHPSDTANRDVRQYVFDVWIVLGTGARYVVVQPSIFDIQPSVTILP